MKTNERAAAQLRKAPDKRDIGGHGDAMGFAALLEAVAEDVDLFEVPLPLEIRCSTCRFLVPEFHEKMPCWICVDDASLPKWRAR